MEEQRLERRLKQEIERRGGQALKFVSPGHRGVPDRIVLMPGGRLWFVEMKATGKHLRPLQARRARELGALGFQVRLVSTDEELDRFLLEVDRQ